MPRTGDVQSPGAGRVLIEKNRESEPATPSFGQGGHFCNALQATSYKGRAEIVRQLLERGVEHRVHEEQGWFCASGLAETPLKPRRQIIKYYLTSTRRTITSALPYNLPTPRHK